MIRPDQIPDAVVEAAAKAICRAEHGDELAWDVWIYPAQDAITAALAAWPGAKACDEDDLGPACLILPLPEAERIAKQEESDND